MPAVRAFDRWGALVVDKSEQDRSVWMPVATRRRAIAFIVLIGFVTLFADMTYEGGRSVAGPFLGMLGASAVIVSVVAGLGEFLGYGVRYLSGRAADRGGPYWTIMGAGYLINLLAVPLLAFAWSWPVAMLLLITERLGRAIRAPIRGAMLSHATSRTGAGWGFGLHAALDQTGGLGGPLLVAGLLALGVGYHRSFALLLILALASLAVLAAARIVYPDPRQLVLRRTRVELAAWPGFGRLFRADTVAAPCTWSPAEPPMMWMKAVDRSPHGVSRGAHADDAGPDSAGAGAPAAYGGGCARAAPRADRPVRARAGGARHAHAHARAPSPHAHAHARAARSDAG